jgi:hypothetical protein
MTRRNIFIIFGAVAILLFVGMAFVAWQFTKFNSSMRNMSFTGTDNVALAAMSDIAVDPSVYSKSELAEMRGRALLDLYKENPNLVQQRADFTKTWLHAGQLAKVLTDRDLPAGQIFNSLDFIHVPLENRTDAWKNAYCVLSNSEKIVVLSSGDTGALNCGSLRSLAIALSTTSTSSRLARDSSGVLVMIWQRARLHT